MTSAMRRYLSLPFFVISLTHPTSTDAQLFSLSCSRDSEGGVGSCNIALKVDVKVASLDVGIGYALGVDVYVPLEVGRRRRRRRRRRDGNNDVLSSSSSKVSNSVSSTVQVLNKINSFHPIDGAETYVSQPTLPHLRPP